MFNNRKKWLINPAFQIKFTGYFTICALVNFLLFLGAVNWYFYKIQQEMVANGISPENPINSFIASQQISLNVLLVAMTALGTGMMFLFGIWLSNKVAGPIYRVTQDLLTLEHTKEKKIIDFREGDFFFELKDALNAYLERGQGPIQKKDDDQAA